MHMSETTSNTAGTADSKRELKRHYPLKKETAATNPL